VPEAARQTDILVLNAGSSSIKCAVFDAALNRVSSSMAEGIGGAARLHIGGKTQACTLPNHAAALRALLTGMAKEGVTLERLRGAAHRVVHGGERLTAPVRVTEATLKEIAACTALAPLHNPHNLAAIEMLDRLAPDLPQTMSFDTAFHTSNPEVATRYALPNWVEAEGIRRYGFHGLSYAGLVRTFPEITGGPLPQKVLAFHLGNGASICAIVDGHSVATTMGYSPLDGLTMGTRAGGIDANAVLRLVEEHGIDRTRRLLNQESGLLGLSDGTSDMRALMDAPNAASTFAVAHFCYWAVRHAGSLLAAMGGCDAMVFTGGIGENAAAIRRQILDGLDWMGVALDDERNAGNGPRLHSDGAPIALWVVPADEERVIARDALDLLDAAS